MTDANRTLTEVITKIRNMKRDNHSPEVCEKINRVWAELSRLKEMVRMEEKRKQLGVFNKKAFLVTVTLRSGDACVSADKVYACDSEEQLRIDILENGFSEEDHRSYKREDMGNIWEMTIEKELTLHQLEAYSVLETKYL